MTLPSVLVAILAAAAPAGAAADADAAALTAAFTRALGTESILAFEPLAAGRLEGNAWLSVKDLLARFSCFDIRSARVIRAEERDGMIEVEIDIAMSALQSSSGRERIPPQRWFLNIVPTERGPRIAAAYTAERHFARRVLRAPTSGEREALLEEARSMPYEVFREIGDEITDSLFDYRPDQAALERSYALAESLLTASLAWEDPAIEAHVWRELATLGRMTRQYPAALAFAETAHQAALRSGNCDLIAATTFTLGSVLYYHMDSENGLGIIRDAAAMADSLDDPRVALRAMHNFIVAEFSRWNLVTATRWSLRLAEISARIRYYEGEANAAGNLGSIHGQLNDYENAWRYRLRAHSLYLAGGNRPFAADALGGLALMRGNMNDLEGALTLYARALTFTDSPDTRDRLNLQMAAVQERVGRLDEAQCTLAGVDEEALRTQSCDTEVVRGFLALSRGNFAEAADCGFRSTRDTFIDQLWLGSYVAATALARLGEHEAARLMYYDTIDRIEQQLAGVPDTHWIRVRYLHDRVSAYRDLTDLLVNLGRSREALQVSERVKGRALIESMTNRRGRRPEHAEAQAEIAATIGRMTELNRELLARRARAAATDDIADDLERVRHELMRVETEAAVLVRRHNEIAERLSLTDALSAIRPDTAAIEFLVTEERTSIFLVIRNGEDVDVRSRAVPTRELVPLVERYLRAIRQRSSEEREHAHALYKVLLAPFESELRGRPSLHIVPDGILWQVPFHALRDTRGNLLIDRWDVAYAASLTTLALSDRKRRPVDARASLVAFGNPRIHQETERRARERFRNIPLAPLPEANREVRTIGGMYRNAAVFTDASATEEEIKKRVADCDILHIATHGMVDDDDPLHSALVLTPSRQEDGLLETRELLYLETRAGLAVLSACDTARGAQTAGEGVVSLSWALQVAGCPTTVVSLWKAESRAASALMIAFHREMLKGKRIPEALRAAQLSLRRNARFAHPFYWAPFIVIGAP